ncbi:MAG: formate dehydrogenase, partial [Sphingomonadales bacterium]|nr:formate dehydrogenase [Sphingomonadales bacterium]
MTQLFMSMDSLSKALGADRIAEALKATKFPIHLTPTGSRGLHWLEPLLEVEKEGVRYGFGPLEVDDMASLLDGADPFSETHAKALGPIEEHPYLKGQTRLAFNRTGVVDPRSLDDFLAHGGMSAFQKVKSQASEKCIDIIEASHLKGRGGAGFPAGKKWRTVCEAEGDEKIIIANANEGDSGAFSDRMMMEGDPFGFLEGLMIAAYAVGAATAFIYVRPEYEAAIRTLQNAVKALADNALTDGLDIHIIRGGGAYVVGEETAMLESMEGRRGEVRLKPPLPAISGYMGKPTLINNVMTLAIVPAIINMGTDGSAGTIAYQLAGNIKHGGLVECEEGQSLRRLVEGYGGGTLSGRPIKAVQVGGPLSAFLDASDLDVALDFAALKQKGGSLGHGSIVVYDDEVNMA